MNEDLFMRIIAMLKNYRDLVGEEQSNLVKQIDDVIYELPSPDGALIQTEGGDYELKPDHQSVWIGVENLSIYITKSGGEGVAVDIYPLHDEMSDFLASTWCLFDEAQSEEESE